MAEFSLFGETPEPQAAPAEEKPAARSRPKKTREPTAKQRRLAAPPPKIARSDGTAEAIRMFDRFSMLPIDEQRKHRDILDSPVDPATSADLQKWKKLWSRKP